MKDQVRSRCPALTSLNHDYLSSAAIHLSRNAHTPSLLALKLIDCLNKLPLMISLAQSETEWRQDKEVTCGIQIHIQD